MLNSIFNFSNKKDRDDFIIAIIVIVFFALLLWWILFKKSDSDLSLGNLPETPKSELALVAPDSDGDGIVDSLDLCKFVAGLPELKGCPEKSDFDLNGSLAAPALAGVTVAGINTDSLTMADTIQPVEMPKIEVRKDSDFDGIYDDEDACPDLKGVRENKGCPADGDGDGVYDKDDACPTEAGTAANDGCPESKEDIQEKEVERIDSDGDGVFDDEDECPDRAGTVAKKGCPDIKIEEEEEAVLEEVKTIQFYYNSSRIRTSSKPILQKVADIMNKYPDYRLKIVGHTDNSGSDEANLVLSKSRAQACYNFLAEKGIPENRMSFEGKGESDPITSNETAEGRHQNRRVEFILTN